MKLGVIAPGIIRTIRIYRGTRILKNRLNHLVGEQNQKGGLTFLFEIDYNQNLLTFTVAINREDEVYNRKAGVAACIKNIQDGAGRVFTIPLEVAANGESIPLLEQVHNALEKASANRELGSVPFLHTLFTRLNTYNSQNECAFHFHQDLQAALQ